MLAFLCSEEIALAVSFCSHAVRVSGEPDDLMNVSLPDSRDRATSAACLDNGGAGGSGADLDGDDAQVVQAFPRRGRALARGRVRLRDLVCDLGVGTVRLDGHEVPVLARVRHERRLRTAGSQQVDACI